MAKSSLVKIKDEGLTNTLQKIDTILSLKKQIEEDEKLLATVVKTQLRKVFLERISKIKWSGKLYANGNCGWFYIENTKEIFPELDIDKFKNYIAFCLDDVKSWPYGLTVCYYKGKIMLDISYFNEESVQKRMEKLGLTFEQLGLVKKTNISYELV